MTVEMWPTEVFRLDRRSLAAMLALGISILQAHAEIAETEFTRSVSESPVPCRRVRQDPLTKVFIEREPYLPFENFLHYWTDRPLFTDTTLRTGKMDRKQGGFYRDVEILKWCGFDGFASIDYPGLYYDQMNVYLRQRSFDGYRQMPVLTGLGAKPKKGGSPYETAKKFIATAANSPYGDRTDGRVTTWCYGGATKGIRAWARALRADPDVPPFFFYGPIPFGDLYDEYHLAKTEKRELAPSAIEAFRSELKGALDDFDGLKMRVVEVSRSSNGPYEYVPMIDPLYREHLLPITMEMLSRPEYSRKRLALFFEHQYANPFSGWQYGAFGTARLRAFLDAALMMRADFLMGFEWNEANENTSIQPTVSSGGAVVRIVDWYRRELDGLPARPRPGDDVSIPNLVVSARQSLRIGEAHHLELLYVPDGAKHEPFSARLVVKGTEGRRLVELPWEKFPTERMTAFSYDVATKRLCDENVLRLELETRNVDGAIKGWTGFDCTRLHPTVNWNYLYSRQALRELLPVKASFSATRLADGRFALDGAVQCDGTLMAVEVLDGTEEVAAADSSGEFDRTRYDLFRGTFTAPSRIPTKGRCQLDVVGSTNWLMRSAYSAWNTLNANPRQGGGPQPFSMSLCEVRAVFLLAVPKSESNGARLVLDVEALGPSRIFDLDAIRENGKFACTYENHARLELERADDLVDYPRPLQKAEASVSATLPSAHPNPVYQLRAVSKSGCVWRSAPIVPVPGVTSPDLVYDFSDAKLGDWLPVRGGNRRFDARLGGGYVYAEPYWHNVRNAWPKDIVTSVPGRCVADGRPVLSFDGCGQCLSFPVETIPNAAPFSLEFEVCPDDAEDRMYWRMPCSGSEDTGLQVFTEKGEWVVAWFQRNWSGPTQLRTGLCVTEGVWSSVAVARTADGFLEVSVDGGKKARTPCAGPANVFSGATFGGNVMKGKGVPSGIRPYKGLLRALRIRHGAVQDS